MPRLVYRHVAVIYTHALRNRRHQAMGKKHRNILVKELADCG